MVIHQVPELRQAVESIGREAEKKGIKNIQDIFVTTGASEAIDICLTALVNDGENILNSNSRLSSIYSNSE